jgi:hypothetical protein
MTVYHHNTSRLPFLVNITSCTLLAASTMQQGKGDSGRPEMEDDWYYGD